MTLFRKMLARHVPDFYILKYLLHDIWNDNVGEIVHKQGPSPDMTLACQDVACLNSSPKELGFVWSLES